VKTSSPGETHVLLVDKKSGLSVRRLELCGQDGVSVVTAISACVAAITKVGCQGTVATRKVGKAVPSRVGTFMLSRGE
jgi:hypothetical protein